MTFCRPYELAHACETAEVAALLARLSPRQRRVLRAYIWQVELGERTVTDWLADPACPVSSAVWYRGGTSAHYWHCVDFAKARDAYLQAGQRWQLGQEQRQVERARDALVRAAPAAAERLIEAAQADPSAFYKVVERWTDAPLPTQEIIEEMISTDADGKPARLYKVRCIALDTAKLTDPRYTRLVKEITDSPRNGLSLKLHDPVHAAESILDRADKQTAGKGERENSGTIVVKTVNGASLDDL